MAVLKKITGKHMNLRPVTEKDAEFTLEIRNNSQLTTYIPKINATLEMQTNWIRNQRLKEGDYFFIIENKEEIPQGTIGFYDMHPERKELELGRWISKGDPFINLESAVIILDYIFFTLNYENVFLNVNKKNFKIINFWKRFGAKLIGELEFDGWIASHFLLIKDDFILSKKKITAVL